MDQIYYEKNYRFQWQWQKAFIIYFFFHFVKKNFKQLWIEGNIVYI